ncbi:3D domain-containing protein [Patescibacteria group bacterium]|jgi:3D (Asp-Asp-Asp) domain-containing protein|nr:3D domain-containing protein [Patescibacteria group bacterium]
MTLYANSRIVRHIRMAVTGLLIASFGVSTIVVPVAKANSVLPNPGLGTILAVSSDTGAIVNSDGEAVAKDPENRPATLKTIYMDSTSYTSRPEECDADPFVTADGSDVRDGIVATNVLPFGTKIRIPTVFGDRIFEVHDRMNSRYSYRVDVWTNDITKARAYGLKRRIPIEIVEYGNNKTQWSARAEKMKAERLAAKRVKEIALAGK